MDSVGTNANLLTHPVDGSVGVNGGVVNGEYVGGNGGVVIGGHVGGGVVNGGHIGGVVINGGHVGVSDGVVNVEHVGENGEVVNGGLVGVNGGVVNAGYVGVNGESIDDITENFTSSTSSAADGILNNAFALLEGEGSGTQNAPEPQGMTEDGSSQTPGPSGSRSAYLIIDDDNNNNNDITRMSDGSVLLIRPVTSEPHVPERNTPEPQGMAEDVQGMGEEVQGMAEEVQGMAEDVNNQTPPGSLHAASEVSIYRTHSTVPPQQTNRYVRTQPESALRRLPAGRTAEGRRDDDDVIRQNGENSRSTDRSRSPVRRS